jgi:hypothetical protein
LAVRRFVGRLLTTAQVPDDLRPGQILQVDARTIVTPEVRDQLTSRRIRWERRVEGEQGPAADTSQAVASRSVSAADTDPRERPLGLLPSLQVWWHEHGARSLSPVDRPTKWSWLSRLDARLSSEVQVVAGGQAVAAAVAGALAAVDLEDPGPTHLVISRQPWDVQRYLAMEHGQFAWCLTGVGPRSWEEVRAAAPAVLLAAPPLTSWLVRRWVAVVTFGRSPETRGR